MVSRFMFPLTTIISDFMFSMCLLNVEFFSGTYLIFLSLHSFIVPFFKKNVDVFSGTY